MHISPHDGKVLLAPAVLSFVEHTNLFFPQVLIPYKRKDDFIMPSEHMTVLRHHLSQVEEILIIGWKGSEEKFQDLLKSSLSGKPVKISAITGGSEAVKENFKQSLPHLRDEDWKFYKNGFTDFMKQGNVFFKIPE